MATENETRWLIYKLDITPAQKLTLLGLWKWVNWETSRGSCSARMIQRDMNLSLSTVRKALKQLEALKLIKRHPGEVKPIYELLIVNIESNSEQDPKGVSFYDRGGVSFFGTHTIKNTINNTIKNNDSGVMPEKTDEEIRAENTKARAESELRQFKSRERFKNGRKK